MSNYKAFVILSTITMVLLGSINMSRQISSLMHTLEGNNDHDSNHHNDRPQYRILPESESRPLNINTEKTHDAVNANHHQRAMIKRKTSILKNQMQAHDDIIVKGPKKKSEKKPKNNKKPKSSKKPKTKKPTTQFTKGPKTRPPKFN